MKLLTAKQKLHRKHFLIDRDGINCLYCELELDLDNCEIEHLDNNEYNNDIENNALSHITCNAEKRTNIDYQIIAQEKLKSNQRRIFKPYLEDKTDYGNSPEIEHNVNVKSFVKQFLMEKIKIDIKILFSDALNGLTYLCGEKFGHCSQITIRRHLDALCSPWAPFMRITENGKRYITKRDGN